MYLVVLSMGRIFVDQNFSAGPLLSTGVVSWVQDNQMSPSVNCQIEPAVFEQK